MPHKVFLTNDAARDLKELVDYLEEHDGQGRADHVLGKIEKTFTSLSSHPERGAHVKELLELGLKGYREVFFKPYRIIYRVMDGAVYVLLIADGRRDMQRLLQQRLFRPS